MGGGGMPLYAVPIKLFECHSCGLLRQPTIGPHSLTRSRPKSPPAHKSQQSEWKGSRQEAPYANARKAPHLRARGEKRGRPSDAVAGLGRVSRRRAVVVVGV
jgi:hypothetical protein